MRFFQRLAIGKAGDELLLRKQDGAAWGKNHAVRPLARACKAAVIRPAITFHELRHTFASLLAQAGMSLLELKELLGHADTRVTSRHYAHLCEKGLKRRIELLMPSFGTEPRTNVTGLHRG